MDIKGMCNRFPDFKRVWPPNGEAVNLTYCTCTLVSFFLAYWWVGLDPPPQCAVLNTARNWKKLLNVYRIRSSLNLHLLLIFLWRLKLFFLIMLMLEEGNMYYNITVRCTHASLGNYSRLRFFHRDCWVHIPSFVILVYIYFLTLVRTMIQPVKVSLTLYLRWRRQCRNHIRWTLTLRWKNTVEIRKKKQPWE